MNKTELIISCFKEIFCRFIQRLIALLSKQRAIALFKTRGDRLFH
ncbi:MAG TPA: hypothetical protein V6C58_26230 [Allocoleopsis sp.]